MGGIFHLLDFNQASTSKKLSQKGHPNGLEAPRNSLELPRETSQKFHAINDDIPYAYEVKQGSLAKHGYPRGGPMKKLIEEDLVKQTGTRRNVPGVVARLMGMDMLPPDVSQSNFTNNRKNDEPKRKSLLHEEAENGSTRRSPLGLKPVVQSQRSLDANNIKQDCRPPRTISKTRKPQPREHPQEEELQKFKKEFEAWQTAMFWERSRSVEVDSYPKVLKDDQFLARQYLNKEKMAHYADANQRAYQLPTTYERSVYGLQDNYADKVSQPYRKQAMHVSRSTSYELDRISFAKQNPEKHSKPTRIVILKPGPERDDETEDSWHGSSEREGCLEDFLEEVKERLRLEIQGNGRRSTTIRGRGVETPFKERPANPKDIARHIAKHVRENVTRDLGMNLLRSESTRSYRNEFQMAGQDSPDFINRDTRKLLSERLTNVLRNEINVDNSKESDRGSRASALANEGIAPRSGSVVLNTGEPQAISGSFRHQERNEDKFNTGDISPRSLLRSLSAPVSGTSFGKLLLEEPHVLTGAQIRRKLEETENLSNEVNKPQKDRFSLRGKVSHLRYSLTLKGKLFGKKIQFSSAESAAEQSDSVKAFMTTPMTVMNFRSTLENSTEVPPSPASLCSSGHEEFPRPGDHPSPVSPLDIPFRDDYSVSQVFKEITSNLHELRQQLNRLQCDGWEEAGTITEDDPSVDSEIMELECEAQVYIRDILIAAGLFDGCTTVIKPIDNWVFREVEESYRKGREGEEGTTVDTSENHKVLFDLLNETLLIIVGPSTSRSRLMRQALEPTPVVHHGKVLFENVWQKIRLYIYPPADTIYSLDNMVACDLRTTKWLDIAPYEIDGIGKEVEWMIWGDLVEEVMTEMCR